MPLTGWGGGIGHHKNLIVPMTFFFSGTINSIGPCNLFPKYCTMAFLVFIMNGLWMRKWLKQSLHYLTNVFNWIGRRECVSRWRRALMFCLIIQYCKWDCFGQRKIFDALLYVNVFHPCPPPPLLHPLFFLLSLTFSIPFNESRGWVVISAQLNLQKQFAERAHSLATLERSFHQSGPLGAEKVLYIRVLKLRWTS